MVRRYSACPHFKDVADDRCGIGIDHRQVIRIIAFRVTERSEGRAILACLCVGFDNCLDLLTRRSSVPFVEQVYDWHHIKCGGILACSIHIIVQCNEADIVTRKNVIHISADFDVITTETAEVFADDKIYLS